MRFFAESTEQRVTCQHTNSSSGGHQRASEGMARQRDVATVIVCTLSGNVRHLSSDARLPDHAAFWAQMRTQDLRTFKPMPSFTCNNTLTNTVNSAQWGL
jgi:hypothetical protein